MSAGIPLGAMRFNSDSQKLEYWNGSAWFQVHTATPNLATAGDPTPGARGLFGGGGEAAPVGEVKNIDYITIASTGNATDFGDTRFANSGIHFTNAAASNSTRGVFGGGTTPSAQVDIMYVTIASTGNASDFGDLTSTKYQGAGASDAHGGLG